MRFMAALLLSSRFFHNREAMVIHIGADHRGFELKKYLKGKLIEMGYSVNDVGADAYREGDDYPDTARIVGEKVSIDFDRSRGVLLCGSGIGVSVVANKYPNVRAALVTNPDQAFDSRNDDDANVLCIPATYVEPEAALQILLTWLKTPFSGEDRHRVRLQKISDVENDIAQALRDEVAERSAALRNEPPPPPRSIAW